MRKIRRKGETEMKKECETQKRSGKRSREGEIEGKEKEVREAQGKGKIFRNREGRK